MYFFAGVFLESLPVYDQTQGSGAVFFFLYRQLYYSVSMYRYSATNLQTPVLQIHAADAIVYQADGPM